MSKYKSKELIELPYGLLIMSKRYKDNQLFLKAKCKVNCSVIYRNYMVLIVDEQSSVQIDNLYHAFMIKVNADLDFMKELEISMKPLNHNK